ncbi:MAG: acetyltransferase [Pseudomonadota bacterium]
MTSSSAPVYLLCAGGHGKVVAAAAEAAGMSIAGFFDDVRPGTTVLGYPVLGPLADFAALGSVPAVICLGDNRQRLEMQARWPRAHWVTIVHPSAVVHRSVRLGAGTVVLAGAVLNPDAVVGAHAIVNTGARVEHDCVLGDAVHLATGVSLGGRVRVDEGALIGTGAAVRPDVHIGEWSVVGVGAAVVRPVPAGVTVAGVPAKPLR